MKVCINAGHCPGIDCGAVGSRSTEADIVKKVAEVVCKDLENVGIETVFVQDDSLANICSVSNNFGADYFVSIHCNSAGNASANGTETWVHPNSPLGYNLGQCIQNQLINTFGTTDRGMKYSDTFYVLRRTDAPACLVELAFISNQADEDFLLNNINGIAHAVARGITDTMQ